MDSSAYDCNAINFDYCTESQALINRVESRLEKKQSNVYGPLGCVGDVASLDNQPQPIPDKRVEAIATLAAQLVTYSVRSIDF